MADTFCMMPWIHMHLWPNGDAFPCCVGRSDLPVGNTFDKDIKQIWNGESMRSLRRNMLIGERSKECQRCYELEESGVDSFRSYINREYGDRHRHVVDSTLSDGTVTDVNMAYLDIRWSNICNLRCRTCGHGLSSSWYDEEMIRNPTYDKPRILNVNRNGNVWAQLVPYLSQTEEVYFAGGESMLTEEHYRLLDHWISIGKTDVKLRYTTNFTVLDYKKRNIFDLWNQFSDIAVGASLDGSHGRGEYLRKNAIWSEVVENRRRMIREVPNVYFELTPTVSLLNVWHLPDFHKEWVELGLVDVDNTRINLLTYPAHTSCKALPGRLKSIARSKILDHVDWLARMGAREETHHKWMGIINFMDDSDDSHKLVEFMDHQGSIDKMRGEDIFSTFPELRGLYDDIR